MRLKTSVDLQVAQNIEFLNFSNTSDFLTGLGRSHMVLI